MEAFCGYSGPINENFIQRILPLLTRLQESKISKVHLLVDSLGGEISGPIAFYEITRDLPIEIYTYNQSSVQSAAVVVYLAGKRRFCSAAAHFMVHQARRITQNFLTEEAAHQLALHLKIDNHQLRRVFDAEFSFDEDAFWKNDKHYDGSDAVRSGLAHSIGEFPFKISKDFFMI